MNLHRNCPHQNPEDSSVLVVLWIGVTLDSLLESLGHDVAYQCQSLLVKRDVADVEVTMSLASLVPNSLSLPTLTTPL